MVEEGGDKTTKVQNHINVYNQLKNKTLDENMRNQKKSYQ